MRAPSTRTVQGLVTEAADEVSAGAVAGVGAGRRAVSTWPGGGVAIASDSMTDTPWTGDACGLVDAYRKGEITPPEALERSLAAMESSALNA